MDKYKTTIEFINHASVLLKYNQTGILSDPWYFNSVFNKGWRLIYENNIEYIKETLNKVSHIYISHEHPDHFRPDFFKNPDSLKKEIIIDSDNVKESNQYTSYEMY